MSEVRRRSIRVIMVVMWTENTTNTTAWALDNGVRAGEESVSAEKRILFRSIGGKGEFEKRVTESWKDVCMSN